MQVGDVVELGRHRLMCGDAFNSEHVDALMRGEKPDMLYCDPPYGMNYSPKFHTADPNRKLKLQGGRCIPGNIYAPVIGDDSPFDPTFALSRFYKCSEQFWWGADYYRERLPTDGTWLVWDKRVDPRLDEAGSISSFELCWSRKSHPRRIARIQWSGLIGMSTEAKALSIKGPTPKRIHPNQKPVALAEWFLSRYSKENTLILDLFAGSGSTLLACERMNRRCFTMEISPDYCQVIIDRYHKMTAQPRLLETVA